MPPRPSQSKGLPPPIPRTRPVASVSISYNKYCSMGYNSSHAFTIPIKHSTSINNILVAWFYLLMSSLRALTSLMKLKYTTLRTAFQHQAWRLLCIPILIYHLFIKLCCRVFISYTVSHKQTLFPIN